MELHTAKLQSIAAHADGLRLMPCSPFSSVPYEPLDNCWSYAANASIGRVLKGKYVFKGIVIAKARITAPIFKCPIENPVAAADDDF